MINENALLKFLDEQAKGRDVSRRGGLIATAVYEGLASRIRAGEFEVRTSNEEE